jgi:hypothetical protein
MEGGTAGGAPAGSKGSRHRGRARGQLQRPSFVMFAHGGGGGCFAGFATLRVSLSMAIAASAYAYYKDWQ